MSIETVWQDGSCVVIDQCVNSVMQQTFDPLPVGWPIDYAEPAPSEPLEDVRGAVDYALGHPLSSLAIADLCGIGTRVTVVVAIAGHERAAAASILAPVLLRQLADAGVCDEDITILIPNALRAPSTVAEKLHSLGQAIVDRYTIVDHDPTDLAELNDLGRVQGIPLQMNYRAAEADLLIAVDLVEPHYVAGFSGGDKTVSMGCVGEATLKEMRAVRFLDDMVIHPAGSQAADSLAMIVEREVGRRAGLMFVLNAVVDLECHIVAVSAGAPNVVRNVLIQFARSVYEIDVPHNDYNIVITGNHAGAGNGRAKKDSLYHASRAAIAIGLSPERVLAKGGVIILPVYCGNSGWGKLDVREQHFYEALLSANDMDTVMQQITQRGVRMGEQRAYMLAHTIQVEGYHVIVEGADCIDLARDCGLIPAHNMLEAANLAETIVGKRPRVLMLPRATHSLCVPINRWHTRDTSSEIAEQDGIYIRSIISDN